VRPTLTANDYEEMIDNYDGKFRNHRKTDGVQIDPKRLVEILSRYEGQDVALLYARHLNKTGLVNGKKKRVTLLLRIKKPPKGAGDAVAFQEFEYIDLGLEFSLCPPPFDCFTNDQ
jgi:hypothetical protein